MHYLAVILANWWGGELAEEAGWIVVCQLVGELSWRLEKTRKNPSCFQLDAMWNKDSPVIWIKNAVHYLAVMLANWWGGEPAEDAGWIVVCQLVGELSWRLGKTRKNPSCFQLDTMWNKESPVVWRKNAVHYLARFHPILVAGSSWLGHCIGAGFGICYLFVLNGLVGTFVCGLLGYL